MKEFDQRYMAHILAMHETMGLDSKDDTEIRMWHLLRTVLEFCDAQQPRIDFDLLLENVRNDFNSDRDGCTCDAGGSAGCPVHDAAVQS